MITEPMQPQLAREMPDPASDQLGTILGARQKLLLGTAVAVLTAFGVFVLPFFFPPAYPSRSASYTAGFNNRVAAVAATVAALMAFAAAWKFRSSPVSSQCVDTRRIPRRFLILCLSVAFTFNAGIGWLFWKARIVNDDSLYFIYFMRAVSDFHQRIYTSFPFNYGPLLLGFPLAVHSVLRPIGSDIQGSYFIALTAAQMAGVVLLYFTLNALPLSAETRKVTFAILSICALCPLLGLNYCLIRSLLPFTALLFSSRIKGPWLSALAFFSIEVLQLSVSSELGVAFAAGACCYALFRWRSDGAAWIAVITAAPAAAVLFVAVFGKAYLNAMETFSRGCINLIVEPLPYILLFLIALVWLVPPMVATALREKRPNAVLLASLSVVSLALIPPALGHCDPAHVLYNGLGIYLLATVAIEATPRRVRGIWNFSLEALLICTQLLYFWNANPLFLGAVSTAFRSGRFSSGPPSIDMGRLEGIVGSDAISVPFQIPLSIQNQLEGTGHYAPDANCFLIDVLDVPTEAAKVVRMNRMLWAIVPRQRQRFFEDPKNSVFLVGPSFSYPQRREIVVSGDLIIADLRAHWTRAADLGPVVLYRNNNGGQN